VDYTGNRFDFSKVIRGNFFRKNLKLNLPVYLDEDNLQFIEKIARKKKTDLSSVVNDILRGDKELAKTMV
jgi:hypothetical protein